MTIKLNQIYESKIAHRSFDGSYSNLFFIPDRRKGSAFGPNGEKIMLSAHQRHLLEPVDVLLHNIENKDAIKQKMIGKVIDVHEFPQSVQRSGFGAGLLLTADHDDVIKGSDIVSLIEHESMLEPIRTAVARHNDIVMKNRVDNSVAAVP